MIEIKKALTVKRKEEKAARWNELKFMENDKWREKLVAQVRKVEAKESRIALE